MILKTIFYTISVITIFALSVQAQNYEDTLMIYGRNRFYKTHLPLGYNLQKQYPVVFVFINKQEVDRENVFTKNTIIQIESYAVKNGSKGRL